MSNGFRQQRLERGRRRAERVRRGGRQVGRSVGVVERPRAQLLAPGRRPAEMALGKPDARLSDSIMELMAPYVRWPPAPSEVDQLEATLLLGAAVWNATEGTSACECERELDRLAAKYAGEGSCWANEMRARMAEIAVRKLALFPGDGRLVLDVRITQQDGQAIVWTTGAARESPAFDLPRWRRSP